MRALGVGLVWWRELAPLFAAGRGLLSVLELEPQTLWERNDGRGAADYRVNVQLLDEVAAAPQHKLVHGVGHPVGGLVEDPLNWHAPMRRCVQALQPAWVSEHLSFNRFRSAAGRIEQTSFLLPPRQTPAGVEVAAHRLTRLAGIAGAPVAFETGVNYLQPRADELPDGEFFARVAERADCAILLDLHNLWANARNGRAPVAEVLDAVPLDRVCELHLAGGSMLGSTWLDAHDGLADERLIELAAAVVPRLPALGAIVFEILPAYVPRVGLDAIARQLEDLWALWRERRPALVRAGRCTATPRRHGGIEAADLNDIALWERSLGSLVLGRDDDVAGTPGLATDPGIAVFRQLVREFRSGRIARVLRYTTLALLRGLGSQGTAALLDDYCRSRPSDLFTAVEADAFARHVRQRIDDGRLQLPLLGEVLDFEHAMLRASLHGQASTLRWTVDPVALFEALERGDPLDALPRVPSEMLVDG